ncbi:hypothetical protein PHYSODRAFT_494065, partial [Phytophthora sojae]
DDAPQGPKEQIRTVTSLHFEPMLQSAAYASWFEDNLRCTKPTFLRIAGLLRDQGVLFAAAKVRQHSFEKKVAAVSKRARSRASAAAVAHAKEGCFVAIDVSPVLAFFF